MVLLLGNGINRISKNYSWEALVDELIDTFGFNDIKKRNKPFPLLYEEILSKSIKHQQAKKEDELLEFIADKIDHIETSEYHNMALNKYTTIMTTNYDYALENSIANRSLFVATTKETRYSLFRKISINGKLIWHIHGESNRPKTICLGYEHYSAYIQNMRNYIVKSKISKSLEKLSKIESESWIDYFFVEDIDIIGLALDFVESDLWWLIIYRSRLINTMKIDKKNAIRYFIRKENQYNNATLEKLEMLNANNVDVIEIEALKYENYYEKVFSVV